MKEFNISYTDATVTHSNKYNQNSGFVISFLFFSNLYQDVVFKLDESGNEFPTTYKNLNLPLYTGQKVTLIALNNDVIAYVDKATNEFLYLTKNLQRDLNYGLKINWRIVAPLTFLAFIVSSSTLTASNIFTLIILALPVCLWLYQRVTNFILEKKVDELITSR